MLKDSFRPHEAYENIKNNLPDFPVGFRGQPYAFNDETLKSGFNRPRPYYAIDSRNFTWSTLLKERKRLLGCFAESVRFGRTLDQGEPSIFDNDFSVDKMVAFYKEHPKYYTSMLVLQFPGELNRFYTPPRSYEGSIAFKQEQLPGECIAGVLTLEKSDIENVEKLLKHNPHLDKGQRLSIMGNYLTSVMVKSYFNTIFSLKQ